MKLFIHHVLLFCFQSLPTVQSIFRAMITNSITKVAAGTGSGSRIIYSYPDLRIGTLLSRYKRFLADVEFEMDAKTVQQVIDRDSSLSATKVSDLAGLDASSHAQFDASGQTAPAAVVTVVHCPNTGSMYKLIPPDNVNPECACSTALEGTKRKYPNTLEMIKENSAWVGVNSALANKMVENALNAKYVFVFLFLSNDLIISNSQKSNLCIYNCIMIWTLKIEAVFG